MSLLVRKAGILNTIQDLGRPGFRKFGVNHGGVMDRTATRLANLLVGNDENAAVVEMHFPAGEIVFEQATEFVVAGADLLPHLGERPIGNWIVQRAKAGVKLGFSKRIRGQRAYLAVRGGFDVIGWLGSSSTNLAAQIGGFEGRPLQTGDRLAFGKTNINSGSRAGIGLGVSMIPPYSPAPIIRVTPGPEFDLVTALSINVLTNSQFQVSADSNRMGFRLSGPPIFLLSETQMLSSAVAFGTVQALPDGKLIVLMADHQTTGGYPRIANVASVDLPLLAQSGPGDRIKFELIEPSQGEGLVIDVENAIARMRVGIRMRCQRTYDTL